MAELSVPRVDFSMLGDLPQVYHDNALRAARERTLADLGAGNGPIDYNEAARKLLSVGDQQGAIALSNLGQAIEQRQYQRGRDATSDQFRRDEATRAQSNSDRSYALQEKQATERPTYQVIEDATGNKRLIKIDPYGRGISDATPTGLSTPGGQNPFAYGKQNENQSKDSGYANRMFSAETVLRDPRVEQAATSYGQSAIEGMPNTAMGLNVGLGAFKNWMHSPEYQKFDQAKRDFVNAVLRRESGAAISQSEFDNANIQYFPAPGDSPEKLAQKRINRQNAIAGVAGGGGPTYRPPFTFDQSGKLVPTENAGQGVRTTPAPQAQQPNIDVQTSLQNAKAAIAAGKPRDAVIQRLRENGIDPSGLEAPTSGQSLSPDLSFAMPQNLVQPTGLEQAYPPSAAPSDPMQSIPGARYFLPMLGRMNARDAGRTNTAPIGAIGIRG